jgi:hypothetical protein
VGTQFEITIAEPGTYEIKAVEGQLVTQHRLAVDQAYLDRTGVDGADLVRAVCDILVEHEALAAIPSESTVEQLADHYPYLTSELDKRFAPRSPGQELSQTRRIEPARAEDHPTHT